MMKIYAAAALGMALCPVVLNAQQVQPGAMILAQAYDRCMATFAVRMVGTGPGDDAIFAAATDGCRQIDIDLAAAARRELPADQAEAALGQMQRAAKPNFMKMLARIRADRATGSKR